MLQVWQPRVHGTLLRGGRRLGQPFVGDNVGRRRVGVVWDHVWAPVALGRYVDDAPSRCTNSGGSVRTHKVATVITSA